MGKKRKPLVVISSTPPSHATAPPAYQFGSAHSSCAQVDRGFATTSVASKPVEIKPKDETPPRASAPASPVKAQVSRTPSKGGKKGKKDQAAAVVHEPFADVESKGTSRASTHSRPGPNRILASRRADHLERF